MRTSFTVRGRGRVGGGGPDPHTVARTGAVKYKPMLLNIVCRKIYYRWIVEPSNFLNQRPTLSVPLFSTFFLRKGFENPIAFGISHSSESSSYFSCAFCRLLITLSNLVSPRQRKLAKGREGSWERRPVWQINGYTDQPGNGPSAWHIGKENVPTAPPRKYIRVQKKAHFPQPTR